MPGSISTRTVGATYWARDRFVGVLGLERDNPVRHGARVFFFSDTTATDSPT